MVSITSLTIQGYQAKPLENTFFRQDTTTDHLALIFPGYGYSASMPVLYYPGQLLVGKGADVLLVEYAYNRLAGFTKLPEQDRYRWLYEDVEAACRTALAEREYQRFTLVGKSLGTLALAHLLGSGERFRQVKYVWLTPLLRTEQLRQQISENPQPSLFVIGTADDQYDPALLAEVEHATGGDSVILEGADHSLEIKGQIGKSLRALERVMAAIDKFVDYLSI